MATIMDTLFGVSTERFQEEREAAADAQALAFARLSPIEKASYGVQRGAYGLAGALGGALGGQDPALARNTMRQQIAAQINFADLKSIADGVELLRKANDPQGAMMLADVYRKAESEGALTAQRKAQAARETQQAIPPGVLTAQTVANLKIGISRLEALPESPERDESLNRLRFNLEELQRQGGGKPPEFLAKEARLQELKSALRIQKNQPELNKEAILRLEDSIQAIEGVPKETPVGEKREAVSAEMFDNRAFKDLTPKEKGIVNKRLEDEEGTRAEKGAPKTYLPGQPIGVKDWQSFTLDVLSKDPVIQRTTNVLSDAPLALEVIRTSTQNDFSAAALPGTMSRLVGKDSSVSNLDIERFARTGGLDDRLAQDAVKFFTGKATDVKRDQAEQFTIALYRGALLARKKKLETSADEFGYLESPNYKKALKNIDDQLGQFTLKTKGAPSSTQSDDDLVKKYLPSEKK